MSIYIREYPERELSSPYLEAQYAAPSTEISVGTSSTTTTTDTESELDTIALCHSNASADTKLCDKYHIKQGHCHTCLAEIEYSRQPLPNNINHLLGYLKMEEAHLDVPRCLDCYRLTVKLHDYLRDVEMLSIRERQERLEPIRQLRRNAQRNREINLVLLLEKIEKNLHCETAPIEDLWAMCENSLE
ncbi:hypothetical protein OQA88_9277 [Cercophora sp. LCS_1]